MDGSDMTNKYIEYKEEILRLREGWHQADENERIIIKNKINQLLLGKTEEELTMVADILTECVNEDIETLEKISQTLDQQNNLPNRLHIA